MKTIAQKTSNVLLTLTVLLTSGGAYAQVVAVKDSIKVNATTSTLFEQIKKMAEKGGDDNMQTMLIIGCVVLFLGSAMYFSFREAEGN